MIVCLRRLLVPLAALCFLGCGPDVYEPGEIRSVLLISIDTLRADHLGVYGFPREITPQIDRLAEEGVRFELAVASNPMTLPSHVTLLTGATPLAHGVHDNHGSRLGPELHTLAESLQEAGLRTAGFVAATVLGSQTGVDRGFDVFDEVRSREKGFDFGQRTAGEVVKRVVDFVELQGETPFFAFVHVYDPHVPHEPPEPFLTRFADDLYAGEIAYVDAALGLLFDALRANGMLDTTLVIVTADHGESLGEHGEFNHSYFAYQATQRIPLIIRAPGLGRGRVLEGVVGLHDVAPTILGLLGIEAPQGMEGMDLSPRLRGEPVDLGSRAVYCESYLPTKLNCNPIFALVGDRWKYISTTRPELYDLESDPREERNLVHVEPERASELALQLEARLQASRPGDALDPHEKTTAQLIALGYLAGPIDATPAIDPARPDPKDRLQAWDRLRRVQKGILDGQFGETRKMLREVERDYPDLIEVYRIFGDLTRAEHKLRRSIVYYELYQRLLEGSPGSRDLRRLSEARSLIGTARLEMGENERALEEFEEAIRIDPTHTGPLRNAAVALFRLGRIDEAVMRLSELLELDPDDREMQIARDRLLSRDTPNFE